MMCGRRGMRLDIRTTEDRSTGRPPRAGELTCPSPEPAASKIATRSMKITVRALTKFRGYGDASFAVVDGRRVHPVEPGRSQDPTHQPD